MDENYPPQETEIDILLPWWDETPSLAEVVVPSATIRTVAAHDHTSSTVHAALTPPSTWREAEFRLPLWLLAVICLAWPVTSLLLARRRCKGRGFAVEPADDAAPPASTEGALK